jgi:saposin
MKLVWLTPLLSIAQSMAPIGGKNDKCTWGPSYWCTSITEAKECATTRFCLGSKQWAAPITTDNQMCKLCTQVIDSIIEQVESNEDNFKPILEQMCDYCSTPDKCIDSIEKHWEDIKDMINNELSSNVVCSALNMCQQADEEFTVNQFTLAAGFTGNLMTPRKIMEIPAEIEDDSDTHVRFAPAAKVKKSVDVNSCSKTCQDCVNWAVDAKALMQSPKRMNQMMKTIHLLCAEIPMSSLCRLVLNKKVIAKIINEVEVDQVCQNTEICTATDSPVINDATSLVPCDDCHSLINDIKVISENDAQHFEFIIRQSCDLIPHPVNDMCKQMASQFAKEATNSLEQVDVDEACHDIGYCGDESEFTLSPVLKTGLSTDYCDYCQTAVQYIEYAIDSDMTSDQIKVGLKKLCEKLGEQTMVETCDGFVDKYYDTIVDDIDNYLDDPEQFCRHLHLCPRGSDAITLEKLIDPIPDECTFGPAYWCKNAENIKKCKAEDYCKNVKSMSSFSIDDCTLGPDYWCKNKENAEKCGATDYCKHHGIQ